MVDNPIHNPPIPPTTPTTSGFDETAGMASEPEGRPETPFSLAKGAENAEKTPTGPSPMDTAASVNANPFNPQNINVESLTKQASSVEEQFQKAQTTLQDPSLAQNQHLMKASTTDLLSQHLSRVNDNMSALANKVGSQIETPYTTPPSGTQAVAHFLDYLTGGQKDLINIANSLQAHSGTMGPSELLTVQLKMSGVQQQMEFFSSLLGKAVDNIKTIMSIQN